MNFQKVVMNRLDNRLIDNVEKEEKRRNQRKNPFVMLQIRRSNSSSSSRLRMDGGYHHVVLLFYAWMVYMTILVALGKITMNTETMNTAI